MVSSRGRGEGDAGGGGAYPVVVGVGQLRGLDTLLGLLEAAVPVSAQILQVPLSLVPQRLKHVFLPALAVREILYCQVDAFDAWSVL